MCNGTHAHTDFLYSYKFFLEKNKIKVEKKMNNIGILETLIKLHHI